MATKRNGVDREDKESNLICAGPLYKKSYWYRPIWDHDERRTADILLSDLKICSDLVPSLVLCPLIRSGPLGPPEDTMDCSKQTLYGCNVISQ